MKIRLLSDLHAEGGFDRELLKTHGEDVTVIAGDLHTGADNVWSMLKQFADHQPNIVFVSGNHEYYHNNVRDFDSTLTEWSKGTGIHFLNPGSVKIGNVTFIGGTLFTNFSDDHISKVTVPRMINDFRLAREYSGGPFVNADFYSKKYEEHSAFFKEAYNKIESTKVFISHFLPDRVCIDKQYQGPDLTNNYFSNNLGDWISELKEVPYFLFGHTHSNVDLMIGGVNMRANPYGYGKNNNYMECIIEV